MLRPDTQRWNHRQLLSPDPKPPQTDVTKARRSLNDPDSVWTRSYLSLSDLSDSLGRCNLNSSGMHFLAWTPRVSFSCNERYERWDRADAVDNFQERLQPYFNQSVSHYYHSVSPQYPNHLSFNTWFLWTVQMILRRGGSGAMASVLGVGKCWHHFCIESWLFIHEAS